MAITRSEWRTSRTSAALGQRASSAFRLDLVPMQQEAHGARTQASIARATAGTTTGGPWSPPMASIEMTMGSGTGALGSPKKVPPRLGRADHTIPEMRCKCDGNAL